MKQLQNPHYVLIQRTDVDLRQLDDSELLTAAPGDDLFLLQWVRSSFAKTFV